jgi:hypothetical protein
MVFLMIDPTYTTGWRVVCAQIAFAVDGEPWTVTSVEDVKLSRLRRPPGDQRDGAS